jgi:hypothetical protein
MCNIWTYDKREPPTPSPITPKETCGIQHVNLTTEGYRLLALKNQESDWAAHLGEGEPVVVGYDGLAAGCSGRRRRRRRCGRRRRIRSSDRRDPATGPARQNGCVAHPAAGGGGRLERSKRPDCVRRALHRHAVLHVCAPPLACGFFCLGSGWFPPGDFGGAGRKKMVAGLGFGAWREESRGSPTRLAVVAQSTRTNGGQKSKSHRFQSQHEEYNQPTRTNLFRIFLKF